MTLPTCASLPSVSLFQFGNANTSQGEINGNPQNQRSYLGRTYQVFSDGLTAFTLATSKNDGMQYLVKGIFGAGVFATTAVCSKKTVKKLCSTMNVVDTYNDYFRVVPDLHYVMKLEFLDDIVESKYGKLISQSFYICSDFALALCGLDFLKIIDTAKISSQIGEVAVYGAKPFSFVAKVSADTLASRFVTAALASTAINCFYKMSQGDYSKKNVYTAIAASAEVAFKLVLLFAATVTVSPFYVTIESGLLVATGSFGLMSVYEYECEERKKTV